MERYKLSWTPSPSDFADRQEVWLNFGVDEGQMIKSGDMSLSGHEIDTPTNSPIQWWVRTFDETGTKQVDSGKDSFTALNLAQLEPAVGLTHEWLSHSPDIG